MIVKGRVFDIGSAFSFLCPLVTISVINKCAYCCLRPWKIKAIKSLKLRFKIFNPRPVLSAIYLQFQKPVKKLWYQKKCPVSVGRPTWVSLQGALPGIMAWCFNLHSVSAGVLFTATFLGFNFVKDHKELT